MLTLKHLRLLIGLFFLVLIGEEIMIGLYDTSLSSPILIQANTILVDLFKNSPVYNLVALIALLALAYSSAALWLGYHSGKWFYILFVISEIGIQYSTPVIAYSGKTSAFESLYFLIIGFTLAAIYLSPLKEAFSKTKPFKVWPMLGLFFIFLLLSTMPGVIAAFIQPGP